MKARTMELVSVLMHILHLVECLAHGKCSYMVADIFVPSTLPFSFCKMTFSKL